MAFCPVPSAGGRSQRSVRLGCGTVLSFSPPITGGWKGVYVHGTGGAVADRGGCEQSVGAGAAFLLRPNLQRDASVTVTGDDHPVSFGSGLA